MTALSIRAFSVANGANAAVSAQWFSFGSSPPVQNGDKVLLALDPVTMNDYSGGFSPVVVLPGGGIWLYQSQLTDLSATKLLFIFAAGS